MVDHNRFGDLVSAIYEGGHDPECWDRAMSATADLFGMHFAFVALLDTRRSVFTETNWHRIKDQRALRGAIAYESEHYLQDPTNTIVARNPRGGFMDTHGHPDWATEQGQSYIRTNKSLFGSSRWLLAYSPVRDHFAFGVSAHFADPDDPFFEHHVEAFRVIARHMHHSRRLAARPPDFDDPTALKLLVDAGGRILRQTPAAEAVLAVGEGIGIRNGRLQAEGSAGQALARALRDAATACDGGPGGITIRIDRPDGAHLLVQVAPYLRQPRHRAFGESAVLVTIKDLAFAKSGFPEAWKLLFGFTAAECRVAIRLLHTEGTLRDVADELGITYATVRVHLTRIFEKAGVRTQAQLTRLLLRTQP